MDVRRIHGVAHAFVGAATLIGIAIVALTGSVWPAIAGDRTIVFATASVMFHVCPSESTAVVPCRVIVTTPAESFWIVIPAIESAFQFPNRIPPSLRSVVVTGVGRLAAAALTYPPAGLVH